MEPSNSTQLKIKGCFRVLACGNYYFTNGMELLRDVGRLNSITADNAENKIV
jgi:hypothetical protein